MSPSSLQVFHLCQTAQQSWFVYNDMFRLN